MQGLHPLFIGISMYKNYIFDLYGTLVDINTDENKGTLWKKVAKEYTRLGARYSAIRLQKEYKRLCLKHENILRKKLGIEKVEIALELVFEELFTQKGIIPNDDVVIKLMKYFRAESTKYIKLYDGVEDVLNRLKEKNKKIYLLSNAQYYFTMPEIEMLDIKKYFDGILISSSEGVKKPSDKFIEILFKRYGLIKEDSIMIGNDSVCDIEGAMNFGIDTFYINSNISPDDDRNKSISATYISPNNCVRDYLKIIK